MDIDSSSVRTFGVFFSDLVVELLLELRSVAMPCKRASAGVRDLTTERLHDLSSCGANRTRMTDKSLIRG